MLIRKIFLKKRPFLLYSVRFFAQRQRALQCIDFNVALAEGPE